MEHVQNPESREMFIEGRIEEIAEIEEMDLADILSDVITFAELIKEDEDAKFYFVELAEKIGISLEEMIEYALQRLKE